MKLCNNCIAKTLNDSFTQNKLRAICKDLGIPCGKYKRDSIKNIISKAPKDKFMITIYYMFNAD